MWSTSTHCPLLLSPTPPSPSPFHTYIPPYPPCNPNPNPNLKPTCTSMAATIAVPCSSRFLVQTRPTSTTSQFQFSCRKANPLIRLRRTPLLTVCFVARDHNFETQTAESNSSNPGPSGEDSPTELITVPTTSSSRRVEEKIARKKSERFTYLIAAIMSTFGITSMAVMAVYYRFSWQMEGGEIPYVEMFGTFALSVGAAVGMEYWARWAHEALWHASLWHMHESHHKPRDGPFELNDVFAIINAVPAIALLNYGFFHKGIVPGLCFGAGLGITVFGMAYMFVHDGLVHRRFQVGPIANVPYLRRVAAAHQLHHTEKFNGVPYGLFLGPKELEEVGGMEELEKEIQRRIKLYNNK